VASFYESDSTNHSKIVPALLILALSYYGPNTRFAFFDATRFSPFLLYQRESVKISNVQCPPIQRFTNSWHDFYCLFTLDARHTTWQGGTVDLTDRRMAERKSVPGSSGESRFRPTKGSDDSARASSKRCLAACNSDERKASVCIDSLLGRFGVDAFGLDKHQSLKESSSTSRQSSNI